MINVKLIVLFLCVSLISSSARYCKICPNHTLCKYSMSGPSYSCKQYDETSRLTKEDVANIVRKINERRNFVALGLSRLLPQAANMNKIFWSEELSVFAQRWVDQCDPDTRPDKEDECRDLGIKTVLNLCLNKIKEDTEVAQNIVSVSGPAPGMIIRSLIDVWFTEGLDYRSSVSYYNNTRDWKTNYFTQLIWGDTDRVGCGKAKFYVDSRNTMIERLVCNFAPRGNIHGKPIYAVGYPATQCHKNMISDKEYPGLCSYLINNNVRKFTLRTPPVSSLLKILNLSNDSVMHDIDPVSNNLRKVKFDYNETNEQRNQRIRHVFLNNSYVPMESIPQTYINKNTKNRPQPAKSKNKRLQYQDRGHSRVYHGHDLHEINFRTKSEETVSKDFRKYDYATEPLRSESHDVRYRKYERNHECTRKNIPSYSIHNSPINSELKTTCESKSNQCTRGHVTESCIQTTKTCQDNKVKAVFHHEFPHEQCPCNTPTTPLQCQCNVNCPCFKPDCSTTICPLILRRNNDNKDETKKPAEFHYYDLFPNLQIRSGDQAKEIDGGSSKEPWLQQESTVGNNFQSFTHSIKKYNQEVTTNDVSYKRHHKQESDYIYDLTDSRERKRRSPVDDMTFKPFWQMDEYSNQRNGQLKSLKYTTLQNIKQKKTRRTTLKVMTPQTTETITVKWKDISSSSRPLKNAVTEKYLSFDELMHLRKFEATASNTLVDARRNEPNVTVEYTTNTPFERKKHCTRKLTCTWTAASITDANGSIIGPGMDGDRGSRNPSGYVEGCTRTSTCTRDYMDRNKFSTLQEDGSTEFGSTVIEDEDYCEKRALNIRRRESDPKVKIIHLPTTYTVLSIATQYSDYESEVVTCTPYDRTMTSILLNNCDCPADSPRIKRNKNFDLPLREIGEKEKSLNENLSYGDLYYLVLQKLMVILKNGQNINGMNTCLCNSCILLKSSIFIVLFIFLYNLTFYLFI